MNEHAARIHALTAMVEKWPQLDDGNCPATAEYWTALRQAVIDAQDPVKVAEWIAAEARKRGAYVTGEAEHGKVCLRIDDGLPLPIYSWLTMNSARVVALAMFLLPEGATREDAERVIRGQNA